MRHVMAASGEALLHPPHTAFGAVKANVNKPHKEARLDSRLDCGKRAAACKGGLDGKAFTPADLCAHPQNYSLPAATAACPGSLKLVRFAIASVSKTFLCLLFERRE
jgi:hypothetical protein